MESVNGFISIVIKGNFNKYSSNDLIKKSYLITKSCWNLKEAFFFTFLLTIHEHIKYFVYRSKILLTQYVRIYFPHLDSNLFWKRIFRIYRSSLPKVFLWKDVPKTYSKFTGEHPCFSVISVRFLCNFNEITLRYVSSPVNLLHVFRTPFLATLRKSNIILQLCFGNLCKLLSANVDVT